MCFACRHPIENTMDEKSKVQIGMRERNESKDTKALEPKSVLAKNI